MALLLLFLLPLLAGVLIPLLPDRPGLARGVALVAPVLQLITAAWLWRHPRGDLVVEWLPRLGLVLELGLDGLSLPLVLLTALLTALAVLASPEQQSRPRLFFSLMLATNLGLVGSFLARNALLFVLAYELILIPTTLLVAIWGGDRRAGAAIRFLTYGAVSGIALLAAVLAFGLLQPGGLDFSYSALAHHQLTEPQQRWLLALVLLAFGLKLPIVPLHGWQPYTYSQAPTPVAMVLSGEGNPEIYVSTAQGRQVARRTRTAAVEASPCFSPDGSQLVYTSDAAGGPQLYLMPAGGGQSRRLATNISGYCAEPDWSRGNPNLIAFTVRVGRGYQIAVHDLSGRTPTRIVSKAPGDAIEPVWLADGRHLIYTQRSPNARRLFILDTETSRATAISAAGVQVSEASVHGP